MKRLFFPVAIAALALSSCKKSSGDEQKAITKENIIGNYKITSVVIKNGAAEVDVFNNSNPDLNWYEACEKDDVYKIKASDVFEYSDEGTKCSGDENYTGSWSLNGNTIDIGDELNAPITSLTATQMVLSTTVSEQGVTLVTTVTLARQ
jgi:Lipocalin-like domain